MGSGALRDLRDNKGTEEKQDQKEYRQLWRCMEILETLESLGPEVSLVLKERRAFQGHKGRTAATEDLEIVDHQDFLDTLVEMEREVLPVPVDSLVTRERWEDQVVKDIKVTQDPVGHLVPREYQDRQGLKVLKGNQVHQDQDPKDLQERRGIQDVLDPQVQRGHQGMLETLVPRESMVPVALKDILDPQDAEVLLGLLVKRVVMVLQGKTAHPDPQA